MARYLAEVSGSSQMYAVLLKNPHDRAEAIRPVIERAGLRLIAYYFAANQVKHYLICESAEPIDPMILEALVISNIATGTATSITITPILTSAEVVEAFKKTAELSYRPPAA